MMNSCELPYRRVSAFKAVVRFLTSRKAFEDMAVDHDVSLTLTKSPELRSRFVDDRLDQYRTEVRGNVYRRFPVVRVALYRTGALVVMSAIVGLVLGALLKIQFGPPPPMINSALQIIGAGIVLWATIWRVDVDAQTIGGETLLERTHWWLFRALYVVGSFLFFVAYTWSAQ
jgi:hypothetical protein